MEITEIRIKLMEDSEDRLRAFCSITIDSCFVVRDLKIIDGASGPFVAMPSRKLAGHCGRCGYKNHLRASYCNHCGAKLHTDPSVHDSPQQLYADVAHPINSECREMIQQAVIEEFNAELSRSDLPGYRSRYDDEFSERNNDLGGSEDMDESRRRDQPQTLGESPEPADAPGSGESEVAGQPAADLRPNKAGPPRPHFDDQDRQRDRTSPIRQDPSTDAEDDFGAGIF